jgi:hypothetical protein
MTSHPSGVQGGRDSDHVPTSMQRQRPKGDRMIAWGMQIPPPRSARSADPTSRQALPDTRYSILHTLISLLHLGQHVVLSLPLAWGLFRLDAVLLQCSITA